MHASILLRGEQTTASYANTEIDENKFGLSSGKTNKLTICAFKYYTKHICHKCSNTCTHIRIYRHRKTDWLISRFPSAVRSIFCASRVGLSVYPRHLCLAYQPSAMFEHVTV